MNEVQVHVTQWDVSVLPLDNINYAVYAVSVEWRGGDRWAVVHLRFCLGKDGEWDFEPSPSNREDDWLDSHRFSMDEALDLAKRAAPLIRVNGRTAAEVLALTEAP